MENFSEELDLDTLHTIFKEFLEQLVDADKLTQTTKAYQATRNAIRHLDLRPGQMVLERTLSELLGMSRTPVREAMIRLENEHLLEIVPRKGFIVAPIVLDDFRHVADIAEVLDELAVRLATLKATDEDFTALQAMIVEQEEAIAQDNWQRWTELDGKFHRKFVEISGNPRLQPAMDVQLEQLYRARMFLSTFRSSVEESLNEHKAILAIMRTRQPDLAANMMKAHQTRSLSEVISYMETVYE